MQLFPHPPQCCIDTRSIIRPLSKGLWCRADVKMGRLWQRNCRFRPSTSQYSDPKEWSMASPIETMELMGWSGTSENWTENRKFWKYAHASTGTQVCVVISTVFAYHAVHVQGMCTRYLKVCGPSSLLGPLHADAPSRWEKSWFARPALCRCR